MTTDTRITKTPKLTRQDMETINKACIMSGLLSKGGELGWEDTRHFGILLYQLRAQTEAAQLAQAIMQIQALPWK